MKVLVSGSTGLVGSALVPFLTTGGHVVCRLVRSLASYSEPTVQWDPAQGTLDAAPLEGCEAVVHLAGENIASGRWMARKKEQIRRSRVDGTRLLADALAQLEHPPRVLVCASAVGFYGDRGDELLTEDSPAATGFLPDVCRQWEAACAPARERGVRVVNLRFGVVLSPRGGALAKMLTPFKWGLGGRIGDGQQFMSWLSLDDAVGMIQQALTDESLEGPVNAVAPHPVTNSQFTQTLGRVLNRPTLFPLPAFVARLVLGEMANDLLLASTRVQPLKLEHSGYEFRHPTLEGALRSVLGKSPPDG